MCMPVPHNTDSLAVNGVSGSCKVLRKFFLVIEWMKRQNKEGKPKQRVKWIGNQEESTDGEAWSRQKRQLWKNSLSHTRFECEQWLFMQGQYPLAWAFWKQLIRLTCCKQFWNHLGNCVQWIQIGSKSFSKWRFKIWSRKHIRLRDRL